MTAITPWKASCTSPQADTGTALVPHGHPVVIVSYDLTDDEGSELFAAVEARYEKMLRSRHSGDADDMVQETFEALLRLRQRGAAFEQLLALVPRVAACKKALFYRKRERRSKLGNVPLTETASRDPEPITALVKADLRQALLDRLPEPLKVVVLGFTVNGGPSRVERLLGCRRSQVYKMLGAVRKALGPANDWL